jgi:hypothetical protein
MEYYKNYSLDNLSEVHEGILYNEEWKSISGYEGLYEISSFGRIKSLKRKANSGFNSKRGVKEKILKQEISDKGYLRIVIQKNRSRIKRFVHVLVANEFVINKNNGPEVNHLKGNKSDNRCWMIEWCTRSENQKHAIKNGFYTVKKGKDNSRYGKRGKEVPHSKPVIKYDTENKIIHVYDSITEAAIENGLCKQNISKVCKGERIYCGGYYWKYKN